MRQRRPAILTPHSSPSLNDWFDTQWLSDAQWRSDGQWRSAAQWRSDGQWWSDCQWWSDRDIPGPTIDLHAAAKPLKGLMYHWAALSFLKKKDGGLLRRSDMEVLSSYLAYVVAFPLTPLAD
jgi:hypothetical protein